MMSHYLIAVGAYFLLIPKFNRQKIHLPLKPLVILYTYLTILLTYYFGGVAASSAD